ATRRMRRAASVTGMSIIGKVSSGWASGSAGGAGRRASRRPDGRGRRVRTAHSVPPRRGIGARLGDTRPMAAGKMPPLCRADGCAAACRQIHADTPTEPR
ncbi:MAG TPA: hypothetical protein P5305_16245, partial [Rubrivivax sp.]|nr:hypothetical protein [Rubrivivax sp.]